MQSRGHLLLQRLVLSVIVVALAHTPSCCQALKTVGSSRVIRNADSAQAKRSLQVKSSPNQLTILRMSQNDSDWNLFRRRPSPESNNMSSYKSQYQQYQQSNGSTKTDSFITREMEEQVMASARASIDDKTVSRAISSLVTENERERRRSNNNANNQSFGYDSNSSKGNSLRDLAGGIRPNHSNQINTIVQSEDTNNSAWDTQQIAIASGVTTCLLSPIIIPIIHSLIPPILPFPSSISFEGAAFLGALAYILALGDPTDQSNVISKTTSGGMLGDGVEVTGAVSRIVGRTALQSVQMSAPRIKAVARAVVDYDSTVNTMEEMTEMQYQLSRRLLELESENDSLKREVALWNAVEDVSSAYKLEELKEIARVNGIRGYSSDGKTALLRRLVKERALDLDLSPYFQRLDEM
ncbi:hypothetical protein ACHAXN_011370 [Cyclotella atomus]